MVQMGARDAANALPLVLGRDTGDLQAERKPSQESSATEESAKLLCEASEAEELLPDQPGSEESLPSPSAFSKGPGSNCEPAEWKGYHTFSPTFSNEMASVSGSDACEDRSGVLSRSIGEDYSVLKEQQWMVSNASHAMATFLKRPEDDGAALKEPDAKEAREQLEKILRQCRALIKSKQYKRKVVAQLRAVFKDGKAVYQECVLRLSMYEASLATQRSVYCAMIARTDPAKLKARRKLVQCISDLSGLVNRAPRRFMAARRDHLHAQTTLKILDSNWLMDLKERCERRPHWVPDGSAAKCAECKSAFSLLRSRHHCRACGMVFCENCSQWALPLPALAYFTEQRICRMCYREHAAHALCRHGSQSETDWSLVAADIAKLLPKAKPLLSMK